MFNANKEFVKSENKTAIKNLIRNFHRSHAAKINRELEL